MNPYFELAQYILPCDLLIHFELSRVDELDSELLKRKTGLSVKSCVKAKYL